MSFLATLRQQHSAKQNLSLCYLLSHEPVQGQLHFTLGLYDATQPPIHTLKAYTLRHEHLQRPPGFFSKKDLALLTTLSTIDAQQTHEQVTLPSITHWSQLKTIIETGHCYFRHPSRTHDLKPVKTGPLQLAQALWVLNPGADYHLHWHLPDSASAQCIPLQHALIYRQFDPDSITLGDTKKSPITAAPTLPKAQRVTASLQAILHCQPSKEGIGLVDLLFTLSDDRYCSMCRKLVNTTDYQQHYWDGQTLYQLNADSDEYQRINKTLSDLLNSCLGGDGVNHQWRPQTEQQWQRLLLDHHPQLRALGVVFIFHKAFKHRYIASESWQIDVDKSASGPIRLKISLATQDGAVALATILTQLRDYNLQAKQRHYQLPMEDGRILLLREEAGKRIMDELEDLEIAAGGFCLDHAQRYRLSSLKDAFGDCAQWRGDLNSLEQAIAIDKSPVILDSQFAAVNATLRPYQWLGVCWIYHLKQQGFNGLLADDMGLGKTLQVISLLAFEKQQGVLSHPALIIVPLSLVDNWISEINTFAPQLNTYLMHGNQRHQYWSSLQDADILISTYPSASMDLCKWQQQTLSWLILDEAQYIKNPSTRWRQALSDIPCKHKLCLSGTPVENHLEELWSIMDFLMPGCLGSQYQFRNHYRKPIENHGNREPLQRLLKRLAPLMLRRTKDQVAQDLPPKTEIIQRIELDHAQRRFYDDIKTDAQRAIQETLSSDSHKGKNTLIALTALLKLRQACCDPALLTKAKLPSAKTNTCINMVESLVAEGRAILIFSQFTRMLTLLQQALDQRQIASLMLTGRSQKRQTIIDDFQQGKAPVFLISLKAGGTGLNLTRADTVIHYDPWWNAAAETQASNRAHRIGQNKAVFVYKLIAADTIEEKVATLQQQKAILSEHVTQQAQINADAFALTFEALLGAVDLSA